MTDYALQGMLRKRAELAGEMIATADRLATLQTALCNLDATIRLFDPNVNLENVKARRIPGPSTGLAGQTSRAALGMLRASSAPLTITQIANGIILDRKLNGADPEVVRIVHDRVGSALRKYRGKGLVRSWRPAPDTLLWALV